MILAIFDSAQTLLNKIQAPARPVVAQKLRELSVLLRAGFPLLKALQLLAKSKASRALANSLGTIATQVADGSPLWKAMSLQPETFPPLAVSIIRSGEASATLEESLEYIADSLEYENEMRNKVQSALTYPAFFGVVSLMVVGLLFGFILPRFKELYMSISDNAGSKVIKSKAFNMMLSVQDNAIPILICILVLTAFTIFMFTTKSLYFMEKLKLRIPIFGNILLNSELSRTTKTLSLLIRSGVPLLQSLSLCRSVADNIEIKNLLSDMYSSVESGASMTVPLNRYTVVPYMLIDMVKVGEEAGSLELTLAHLSKLLRERMENSIERLTGLIQPIVMLVMGIFVTIVILGLFIPYFDLMDQLQTSKIQKDSQMDSVQNHDKVKRKYRIIRRKPAVKILPPKKQTTPASPVKQTTPALPAKQK